jgi:hypothetical protein
MQFQPSSEGFPGAGFSHGCPGPLLQGLKPWLEAPSKGLENLSPASHLPGAEAIGLIKRKSS